MHPFTRVKQKGILSRMIIDQRLKVAVLIKRFVPTGGAERYALEVTRRIALLHEVHVFAQEWSFEGQEKIVFHKIPRRPAKPSWLNQILFSYFSRKALGNGFDIVHSHEKVTHFDLMTIHSPCFRSFLSQEQRKGKRIFSWLSVAFSPRKLAWLGLERKQFAYHPERIFIAVSEWVQKDVQANYPLPERSFHIAYPGADARMKRGLPAGTDLKKLRSKLSLAPNDPVFLFVGTEFKRKGLDALLHGLALIRPSRARLVVAGGGGGNMEKYVELTRKLGLNDRVSYLGLVENVEELYALADALVLPTLSDPWAMAPMEAMLSGLPAAVSSAEYCGAAGFIKDNEALIIKDPTDPREIAKTLRKLTDAGLRAELSRKGRVLAAGLTWEKTTENTLSAYHEVLRRKGRAQSP
jgi:UDP-glucose:(heptosyl)LPS alpha-1,3-glucosyltransferase